MDLLTFWPALFGGLSLSYNWVFCTIRVFLSGRKLIKQFGLHYLLHPYFVTSNYAVKVIKCTRTSGTLIYKSVCSYVRTSTVPSHPWKACSFDPLTIFSVNFAIL